ncbi:hypothetical protein BGZ83_009516 [Gryganskiella cystojenkinii]|nr:hypothetical protein BGZ83_009516 [Gryganskiella cystojenkinii]
MTPALCDLPPELQEMILSYLTKHDLCMTALVSKYWHERLVDRIFHTLEIKGDPAGPSMTFLRSLVICNSNRESTVRESEDSVTAITSLSRNLHRIRTLRVRCYGLLDIFVRADLQEQQRGGDGLNHLQELCVGLEQLQTNDIALPESSAFSFSWLQAIPPTPGFRPILDLIQRLTRLKRFTIDETELSDPRAFRLQDRVQLLATGLPPSLDRLIVKSDSVASLWSNDIERERDRGQKSMDAIREMISTCRAVDSYTHVNNRDVAHIDFAAAPPPAFMTGSFLDRLSAISFQGGMSTDFRILQLLLRDRQQRPPKDRRPTHLEELNVIITSPSPWVDEALAEFINHFGCPQGWKTIGLANHKGISIDHLTIAAVLEHSTTLENLRISNCAAFLSPMIQQFLCSASKLKRLDLIPSFGHFRMECYFLMASDVALSSEDWICHELESFKCIIGGIPEPTLKKWTEGVPNLRERIPGWDTMMIQEQGRALQLHVLSRLARLSNLVEISLGVQCYEFNHRTRSRSIQPSITIRNRFQKDPYQGLDMSLASGLSLLKDLKSMRKIRYIDWARSQVLAQREYDWMRSNWPLFETQYQPRFWTERGHGMSGVTRYKEYPPQRLNSTSSSDALDFDWW